MGCPKVMLKLEPMVEVVGMLWSIDEVLTPSILCPTSFDVLGDKSL